MQISLITGADGAPFVHDLAATLEPGDELTVIAPTVRGHWSAGLAASPDLDALLTSPAASPSHSVCAALQSIGYIPAWQQASDDAVAIRLVRTDLLTSDATLTDATVAAATRSGLGFRLLPMCDSRAEFRVVVGVDDQARAIHVEEYLADPTGHEPSQLLLVADGIAVSSSVSEALQAADVLVLGPSSRTLAIDPVLRTPGFREQLNEQMPILIVDHVDTAPADLVRVAGLQEPLTGRVESVAADAATVLTRARQVTA